jgi:hypothetical protein
LSGLATSPAAAGGLDSQPVAGFDTGVSCISPSLCVLVGYNEQSAGDVVRVENGVPKPNTAVAGAKELYSVSCVGGAGCVAVGEPASATGPLLVTLGRTGAVTSSKVLTVPPGVTLTRISCVSLSSCTLSGDDIFTSPELFEIAHWDGTSLSLRPVRIPSGTTGPELEAISCSGATCVAVGSAFKGASVVGIVVRSVAGGPVELRTVAGDSLYGVSCVSTTLCYAAGFTRTGGFVVTIHSGVAVSPASATKPDLFAIACHDSSCWAVGEILAPPGAPAKDVYYGAVLGVSAGKVTSTQLVAASDGFTNVSRYGDMFAALGAGRATGSEVTTGT